MTLILAGQYISGEILTGPEKAAKRLFEELLRSGEEATFVEYIGREARMRLCDKLFGRIRIDPAGGGTVERKGIVPIIRLARSGTRGVVHLLLFDRASMLYALCRRREGFRIIYTVHGVIRHEEKAMPRRMSRSRRMRDRLAERVLFRRADRLVFVSEKAREIAARYYPIDPAKSAVISNGVDPVFAQSPRGVRPAGSPLRIVLHGAPGRPDIRFPLLLQALAGVRGPVELYSLHDDPPARRDGIPEHLRLVESRRMPSGALARFYADKDVICSLKAYDTFSIATAEAMAAGVIPIVTEETGIARFIQPGKSGFRLRGEESRELAEALNIVQGDPAAAAALSDGARRAAARFSWEKTANSYRELYRRCME